MITTPSLLGILRNYNGDGDGDGDGDGNRNVKKAIGSTSKRTTLHVNQAFW